MRDNRLSPFDEIDYRISQELRKDARMSASEIARSLGINQRTVRNRIDRMVDLGAARPYWVFEPKAFGYVISVDILIKIDKKLADDICLKLINLPQVSYLAAGNGKENLSIEGLFRNLEEMDEFIHHTLPSFDGVEVKSFALVPRVMRNLYEWEPDAANFNMN